MKKAGARILMFGSIAVSLFFIIYFLSHEPSQAFIESKTSWLKVRGLAFLLASVISFMIYTGGKLARGAAEIELEHKYVKNKDNSDLTKEYNGFEIFMIEAPLIGWMVWWVFCFEAMATFYVSDWLKYGI